MGRHKIGKEARNWPLNVKVTKSIGKYLDSLLIRLGWSKATFLTQLILRFGELLVKEVSKEGGLTYYGEGKDPPSIPPPVNLEDEEMENFGK